MTIGTEYFSDKVIGWIGSGLIGLLFWLIQRRLEPGAKLRYWMPHDFLFQVPLQQQPQAQAPQAPQAPQQPQQPFIVRTNTLTVQNLGRKVAENVQIIHADKPDHFQMHPRRNYSEDVAPDRTHVITIESLGPKEVIQLQILSYIHAPTLIGVRSKDGEAKPMAFQVQRVFPRWALAFLMACTITGAFAIVYWLVRAVLFISRENGML